MGDYVLNHPWACDSHNAVIGNKLKLIFFLSDVRLCYEIYIWLNLLKRGYRKRILTIWMENSEKSLARAQKSQLYCLQQTNLFQALR